MLADGDVVDGAGWALEAITTPGHCANHMAFALKGTDILFSGDHVMAWSTPVVAPPDGSMSDYMASLDKLVAAARRRPIPGPRRRGARRAALRAAIHPPPPRARGGDPRSAAAGETDIPSLVRDIYVGLDPRLTTAAGLSVLAHLEDLVERAARSRPTGAVRSTGRYRLA